MRNLFKIDFNVDKSNQMDIFYIEEDTEIQQQFDQLFENLHSDEIEEKKLPKECALFCPLYKKANRLKQK